ncbi:hypothetical protein VTJ49DRAFT_6193 [Mycothermus thermophilus]|uniref:GH18 domain-containing protein n=1 Tax=Humicola insolens TaxID=85995 RepID=A0ABR3VKB0_HUMIN
MSTPMRRIASHETAFRRQPGTDTPTQRVYRDREKAQTINGIMKRPVSWLPLVLSGLSAATAFTAAEGSANLLAPRDSLLFSGSDRVAPAWHRHENRQEEPSPALITENLTPEKLAELVTQLRLAYAYLAAYQQTRQTGLLNNLVALVGNLLPPLDGVTDALRALLIGDNVTIREQIAIAKALGLDVVTTTVTVGATPPGPAFASATGTPTGPDALPATVAITVLATAPEAVAAATTPASSSQGWLFGPNVPPGPDPVTTTVISTLTVTVPATAPDAALVGTSAASSPGWVFGTNLPLGSDLATTTVTVTVAATASDGAAAGAGAGAGAGTGVGTLVESSSVSDSTTAFSDGTASAAPSLAFGDSTSSGAEVITSTVTSFETSTLTLTLPVTVFSNGSASTAAPAASSLASGNDTSPGLGLAPLFNATNLELSSQLASCLDHLSSLQSTPTPSPSSDAGQSVAVATPTSTPPAAPSSSTSSRPASSFSATLVGPGPANSPSPSPEPAAPASTSTSTSAALSFGPAIPIPEPSGSSTGRPVKPVRPTPSESIVVLPPFSTDLGVVSGPTSTAEVAPPPAESSVAPVVVPLPTESSTPPVVNPPVIVDPEPWPWPSIPWVAPPPPIIDPVDPEPLPSSASNPPVVIPPPVIVDPVPTPSSTPTPAVDPPPVIIDPVDPADPVPPSSSSAPAVQVPPPVIVDPVPSQSTPAASIPQPDSTAAVASPPPEVVPPASTAVAVSVAPVDQSGSEQSSAPVASPSEPVPPVVEPSLPVPEPISSAPASEASSPAAVTSAAASSAVESSAPSETVSSATGDFGAATASPSEPAPSDPVSSAAATGDFSTAVASPSEAAPSEAISSAATGDSSTAGASPSEPASTATASFDFGPAIPLPSDPASAASSAPTPAASLPVESSSANQEPVASPQPGNQQGQAVSASNPAGFVTSVLLPGEAQPSEASTSAPVAPTPDGSDLKPEPSGAVTNITDATSPILVDRSDDKVAAYFGLPGTEPEQSLAELCADPNVDIIILGFVSEVKYGDTIYPRLQLASNPCLTNDQTSQMKRVAPGLSHYPELENDITECQTQHGKQVLVSIGGPDADMPLDWDEDAVDFANRLWELFGPEGAVENSLRPFGSAVVDGFDLNKQDECASNYDTFASTLRTHFASDASKDYLLTAVPGCAYPDMSIHPGYLAQTDYVWPRFYDDPRCEAGSAGFLDAVRAWSDTLSTNAIPTNSGPASSTKLLLGVPARADFFTSGLMPELLEQAREAAGADVFGGVAVSDGDAALDDVPIDGEGLLAWLGKTLKGVL